MVHGDCAFRRKILRSADRCHPDLIFAFEGYPSAQPPTLDQALVAAQPELDEAKKLLIDKASPDQ